MALWSDILEKLSLDGRGACQKCLQIWDLQQESESGASQGQLDRKLQWHIWKSLVSDGCCLSFSPWVYNSDKRSKVYLCCMTGRSKHQELKATCHVTPTDRRREEWMHVCLLSACWGNGNTHTEKVFSSQLVLPIGTGRGLLEGDSRFLSSWLLKPIITLAKGTDL